MKFSYFQDLPMIGKKGRNLPILGKSPKAGFSLLELSAVLLILAVVTMLASREISKQQHQLRYEKSNQLLEDIQIAIIGDRWEKDDIKRSFNFVSDMGRRPKAKYGVDRQGNFTDELTLRELFVKPDDAPVFGRYSIPDAEQDAIDKNVYLHYGWRGPYLRLPPGKSDPFLYDGWGNPMTSRNGSLSSDDLPNRLLGKKWSPNEDPKIMDGDEIWAIRHLGANALEEEDNNAADLNPYHRDEVVTNAVVSVDALEKPITITGNITLTDEISESTLQIRLYAPGEWDHENKTTKPKHWDGTFDLENAHKAKYEFVISDAAPPITSGRRALRAMVNGKLSKIRFVYINQDANEFNFEDADFED